MRTTGAGLTCLVGMIVGLGIAAAIIVQTMLSMTLQYATEFVTLRIMGARRRIIALIIVLQGLGLGLAAFVPAALVAVLVTRWLRAGGGSVLLPAWSLLAMTAAVVILCLVSAGLPVARILAVTRRKLV
jgi:ABC-type antimicrobial peptide transport system permease subunit